jgi:uncharacterized membrane protein YqaE (UPF0057 family)
MPDESTLQLLDRRYARLVEKEGAEYLRELRTFIAFLEECRDVKRALDQLRAEAQAAEDAFREHDEHLVPQLVALRDELIAQAPEADDSQAPRPESEFDRPPLVWLHTFANFDAIVDRTGDQCIQRTGSDDSRSGMLIAILAAKLRKLQWEADAPPGVYRESETNQRPDLNDIERRLGNVARQHAHAVRTYEQAVTNNGGFQVAALDHLSDRMNPTPRTIETEEDEQAFLNDEFMRIAGGMHAVADAVSGRSLDDTGRHAIDFIIRQTRPAVESVYEGIRGKLTAEDGSYWAEVNRWVFSRPSQFLSWPLTAGAITSAVTREWDAAVMFTAIGVLASLLPPLAVTRPRAVGSRAFFVSFVVTTMGAVVALLLLLGPEAAVLGLVVLAFVYSLGQVSQHDHELDP